MKYAGQVIDRKYPKGVSAEEAERTKQELLASQEAIRIGRESTSQKLDEGFRMRQEIENARLARAKDILGKWNCRVRYTSGYYVSGLVSRLPAAIKERYVLRRNQLNGHPAETYGKGQYVPRNGEYEIRFQYWKDFEPFITALEEWRG